MKKITLIFFVLFVSSNMFAQTNMKIRKSDNSVISIPIAEIDSIYYEESFPNCGIVTDFDGNIYSTVQIGEQCWITEDLQVTHYPNGDEIPHITDNTEWANLEDNNSDDAYCFYNNDNNTDYGALYTWAAAMGDNAVSSDTNPSGVQGVCPNGWHLPSDEEWTELIDYLGGASVAGGKMKSVGTTHWESPNTGAVNSSNFLALPGGSRSSFDGLFNNLTRDGIWWSTTNTISSGAKMRYLMYDSVEANYAADNISYGISVRCIKD